MSIRLRRLLSDYEKIRNEFTGHRHIFIEPISGNPPEKYRITYHLKSLCWDSNRQCPIENNKHEVIVYLPQDYPRNKPQCTILTPIFHPNFSANHTPNVICIGDHWAASSSLTDVVVQIGEMLQFRTYNVKSPLNAEAARWVMHNEKFLPIGAVDMYQPEPDVEFISETPDQIAEQEDDLEISFAEKPDAASPSGRQPNDDIDIEFV